jgi:hypothetical protein
MLDDRVRAVLARLEAEDADERARGVPREERARQVTKPTGQFLFALVAPQWDCEVLEIGGSRTEEPMVPPLAPSFPSRMSERRLGLPLGEAQLRPATGTLVPTEDAP